jgi:hypothetical protein
MITFKMNILNFDPTGSYSVEYIPDRSECTPIKLNIQLDARFLASGDKEEILNRLKCSAPQDYWERELLTTSPSSFDHSSLVNTVHEVSTIDVQSNNRGQTTHSQFAGVNLPGDNHRPTRIGQSTPEEFASNNAREKMKLKLLIQEVIEEMAEGTV